MVSPNPRLQRTPSASPPSPLSRKPLGAGRYALAFVLASLTATCQVVPHATVAGQLRRLAGRGPGTTVQLSKLTDFRWSRFVWLQPYTMRQQADAALGFAWPEYDKFGLEQSDAFSLLVFAENGRVVRVEEQKRGQGEFVYEVSARSFGPADAVFTVVERNKVLLYAPAERAGA